MTLGGLGHHAPVSVERRGNCGRWNRWLRKRPSERCRRYDCRSWESSCLISSHHFDRWGRPIHPRHSDADQGTTPIPLIRRAFPKRVTPRTARNRVTHARGLGCSRAEHVQNHLRTFCAYRIHSSPNFCASWFSSRRIIQSIIGRCAMVSTTPDGVPSRSVAPKNIKTLPPR